MEEGFPDRSLEAVKTSYCSTLGTSGPASSSCPTIPANRADPSTSSPAPLLGLHPSLSPSPPPVSQPSAQAPAAPNSSPRPAPTCFFPALLEEEG